MKISQAAFGHAEEKIECVRVSFIGEYGHGRSHASHRQASEILCIMVKKKSFKDEKLISPI